MLLQQNLHFIAVGLHNCEKKLFKKMGGAYASYFCFHICRAIH